MLFNSHIFIFLFLPITVFGFFKIGGWGYHRIAISWLVAASLFFYGWWNPAYLGLMLFSIFFNYSVGIGLVNKLENRSLSAKILLIFGIGANLALLGYFKYANFFVDSVNTVFEIGWNLEKILLPLALSFFTFQQIAYLVDTYRGETREYNFLHYCLFVTFFPQLIAGPIVHHHEMLPQFAKGSIFRFNHTDFAVGLTIFFIGLFKKVIIADHFALYATPVFSAAEARETLTFFSAWKGTIAYSLQLYFDFSGYSDMAIGLARLFGVKLPLNFNSPYRSTSIIEFWRRWHMTLSRFLRDYLYYALGGNRKGPIRRYINLLLTMLLGGLWHGAGWTFVIWGGLHGLYLIVNHAWRFIWRWRINRWWSRTLARTLTLFFVMIGWVFFRAESFDGALHILKGMANLPTTLHHRIGPVEAFLTTIGFRFEGGYLGLHHYTDFCWAIFWLAVVWVWPNTQQWMSRFEPAIDALAHKTEQPFCWWWERLQWKPSTGWAVVTSFVALTGVLGLSQLSEFLYFQF